MRKLLLLALLSLGLTTLASAGQHGGMASAAPPPAMHAMVAAPVASAHVAAVHPPSQVHAGSHVAAPGTRSVVSHRQAPAGRPVILPPVGITRTSGTVFPGTFQCRHFSYPIQGLSACQPPTGVVLPFFGGAFYVPMPYYGDSAPPQEEAQDNGTNEQPESSVRADAEEPLPQPSSQPGYDSYRSEEPQLAEFVFVKRDGSTLFAVAYTLLKDKILYVTKDGMRRTVAFDSLDLDATLKLNEEHGTTINLPTLPASGIA